jgi:hypothetical protein
MITAVNGELPWKKMPWARFPSLTRPSRVIRARVAFFLSLYYSTTIALNFLSYGVGDVIDKSSSFLNTVPAEAVV